MEDNKLWESLRNPPKKYRPHPFWSWNERLNTESTREQIGLMDEAGLGGFFMHARGGLETPYMGEEWMDNIRAGIEEGKKRGMYAWGYDENGWPSGFSDGKVNALGEEYQQKYLRWEWVNKPTQSEHSIACVPCEGRLIHFFYEVNPFYVDLLNPKVTETFLRHTHEKYAEQLGEDLYGMTGFFTDEPQLSRSGIPWSLCLPVAYYQAYGEELKAVLPELYFEVGNWRQTRLRFWRLVRDRFVDCYMRPLQEWCHTHGVRLTGHMLLEETVGSQLICNAAVMPSYAYMDMPGMDCLCRQPTTDAVPLQVSSVAHQLGKKQILSETFAACGWNVNFEDMRWISEHQMVRGVTMLCPHLEGYSLRGIRKRDYPASLFYHQPWWKEYRQFNDYVSRIGMLMSEGEVVFDVLVLHPQPSAWVLFNDRGNPGFSSVEATFPQVLKELDDAQILYHLGDEWMIEKYGVCENGRLRIGSQQYSVVVVPPSLEISCSVVTLLEQFAADGGVIIWCDRIPETVDGLPNSRPQRLAERGLVCRIEELSRAIPQTVQRVALVEKTGNGRGIAATVRRFGDTRVVYLVNSTTDCRQVTVQLEGTYAARLCETDGSLTAVNVACSKGVYTTSLTLEKRGSAVLFDSIHTLPAAVANCTEERPLELERTWSISESDDNLLTLDVCACYFDGECIGETVSVTDIQELACLRKTPVSVEMVFRFVVNELPLGSLQLIAETPWNYRITLNGQPVDNSSLGTWRDTAFHRLALPQLLVGENELRIHTNFAQSKETYDAICRSLCFESEKNKLTYDQEIEPFYLLGRFGIESSNPFSQIGAAHSHCDGQFAITSFPSMVTDGDLTQQGFPFFAGSITLSQTLWLSAEDTLSRCLNFSRMGAVATCVRVNGTHIKDVLWAPYRVSLDGLLREGNNRIDVTLRTSMRNLLGPHHSNREDDLCIGPGNFFHYSQLWCGGDGQQKDWNAGYTFATFGVFFEKTKKG